MPCPESRSGTFPANFHKVALLTCPCAFFLMNLHTNAGPVCAGNVCVSAAVMRSNFPRKPENPKTRKRTGKRENRENAKTTNTRKRENRENRENGTFIQ